MGAPFTIEFYEDAAGRCPVESWMEHDLDDVELAALLAALERVLGQRGIDVCSTEWGKALGQGLYEFRVRHTASEIIRMFQGAAVAQGPPHAGKVLLRVFFHPYGDRVILLLHGYDKGAAPSPRRQQQEIERARANLREFKRRRAAAAKPQPKRSGSC